MKNRFYSRLCILQMILSAYLVNAQQPKLMLPFGHTMSVNSAAFSPNGKWIVTASSDHTAKIWDVTTGQLVTDLRGHNNEITSATFSPNGKWVVTTSQDSTARVWDAVTGQLVSELKGHTSFVDHAVFSSDGKLVLTTSQDSTVKIWN